MDSGIGSRTIPDPDQGRQPIHGGKRHRIQLWQLILIGIQSAAQIRLSFGIHKWQPTAFLLIDLNAGPKNSVRFLFTHDSLPFRVIRVFRGLLHLQDPGKTTEDTDHREKEKT